MRAWHKPGKRDGRAAHYLFQESAGLSRGLQSSTRCTQLCSQFDQSCRSLKSCQNRGKGQCDQRAMLHVSCEVERRRVSNRSSQGLRSLADHPIVWPAETTAPFEATAGSGGWHCPSRRWRACSSPEQNQESTSPTWNLEKLAYQFFTLYLCVGS